tara:strand:+ start:289 stop:510 length:222 start_codon:yes stop_codon:yes gene_type:complete
MKLKNILNPKKPINEGMKSNIKQRWKTVKDIENDLIQYITDASDAGGPDLVKDIMKALSKARDLGLDLSMHRE